MTSHRSLRHASWLDRANCIGVDADLFFPDSATGGDLDGALEVCRGCEVRAECLAHALANDERYGVWGGLGPAERSRLVTGPRSPRRRALTARRLRVVS